MKEEPSDDLLVIMSLRMDNPEEGEKAFNEFYRRYYKYVWAVVCKIANDRPILAKHKTGREDILTDTFLTVYDKADEFRAKPDEDVEKQVRLWLVGIIKILYKRWIAEATKHRKHLDYVDVLPDELFDNSQDPYASELVESIPLQHLRNALDTQLNGKEKEILLSWYEFFEVDSANKKIIPGQLKEAFCKAHGIKPDSIRQIKGRALKKLKEALTINLKPLLIRQQETK